jgi:hypothetical protein
MRILQCKETNSVVDKLEDRNYVCLEIKGLKLTFNKINIYCLFVYRLL